MTKTGSSTIIPPCQTVEHCPIYNNSQAITILCQFLDTNILVAALGSRKGASFKVLSLIGKEMFQLSVPVPLVLEYESAAKGISNLVGLRHSDIDDILGYIRRVAEHRDIYYLWRPFLRDPMNYLVLEVAMESKSNFIMTHNTRDFAGIEQFGLQAITLRQLLEKIGELS